MAVKTGSLRPRLSAVSPLGELGHSFDRRLCLSLSRSLADASLENELMLNKWFKE